MSIAGFIGFAPFIFYLFFFLFFYYIDSFVAHKVDVPDHGFSERVAGQLPERRNILPQIVMVVFVVVGLTLTFSILGVTPLLEQLGSLITSISQMQMPSPVSIVSYLGMLALLGIIGYSVAQADVG